MEASKSTEFRNQDASLLEEVKITIFGSAQRTPRHYPHATVANTPKAMAPSPAAGAVQIDLQSAAAAELLRTRQEINRCSPPAHVETRNVKFNQASGIARTEERVTFTFPEGTGEAAGVEYNSQEGTLQLLHDVKMSLRQTGGPKGAAGQAVHVSGSSLDFNRDTATVRLFGPAHAESPTAKLDAGEITLNLDEDYRAQKVAGHCGSHR